ncbi:MAG: bifunctional oligoribonuclease/PAP phosphatase NrnA [Coriobacteriaceae bacterium]|nr:bifunctional oligoribonuclease/PAP phosphatase NrnA [Coriobacteriaceae bacterium]
MGASSSLRGRVTAPERWSRAVHLIEGAGSIAVCGHTNPDGDALGSCLGLGLSLSARFPEKQVTCLLADEAPVPRIYRFLAGSSEMVPASSFTGAPDLFISVDVPTRERLRGAAEVADRAASVLTIDHHPARSEFADEVIRETSAAATACLIEELLQAASIPLTPEVATCLLTGLVTDTGRFQYQNADPAAFACASRLVDAGAEPARISLEVYQSQRIEYLQLESIVMGRIRTVADGRVAYSYTYASDLEVCRVSCDECDGLVDVVRSVQGTEVCLFLKEISPGEVRGNLRSKGALDISPIALALSGGGHAAAAGFTFAGTVDEALDAVLPQLVSLVEHADPRLRAHRG